MLLKNDVMQSYLCDKLWRKTLFEEIIFSEGKTYEDIEVMYKLFERAKKIVCLPDGKYHYLQRLGSITKNISLANRIDYHDAALKRYEDMRESWPQFLPQLEGQCLVSAIGIWCSYLHSTREEKQKYRTDIQRISQFSKLHYKSAYKYLKLGKAGKIIVILTKHTAWWAFALAEVINFFYKKKKRKIPVKRGR